MAKTPIAEDPEEFDDDADAAAAAGKPVRIGLKPRDVTVRYLKQLKAQGTFGGTLTQVATRLVDEGIRQAIKDGWIEKEREL